MSELQNSNICITNARSEGMASECDDLQLDRVEPICLPAMEVNRGSINEVGRRSGTHDSHSTQMGSKTMIPYSIRPVDSRPNTSPKKKQSINTITNRNKVQRVGSIEPSCMEIIKRSAAQKGFSEMVANRIASDFRNSSRIIMYDSKSKCFTMWLREKGIKGPLQTNIPNIAEFLSYLFEEKGLEVSTINGYKVAITKVLQLVTLKL